jgi:hypothetical protein
MQGGSGGECKRKEDGATAISGNYKILLDQ